MKFKDGIEKRKKIESIFAWLLLIGFLFAIVHQCDNTTTPKTSVPEESNVNSFTPEQIQGAKEVMDMARMDCNIFEEGSHLVVEMNMYISDPNLLLKYVTAIANCDAVVNGKPRTIFFYDPSNKQVAQADTLRGIRLIDK